MNTEDNLLLKFQNKKKPTDEDLAFTAIVSYLQEQSLNDYIKEHKDEINEEEISSTEPGRLVNLIPYLNELKLNDREAIGICQIKAKKLLRIKNVVIKKHLERAYDIIYKDQLEFWGNTGIHDESDTEGVNVNNLMPIQDTNEMNKGVVSLWKVPTVVNQSDSDGTKTVDETTKKNGKKRTSKDSRETPTKKQKGRNSFFFPIMN